MGREIAGGTSKTAFEQKSHIESLYANPIVRYGSDSRVLKANKVPINTCSVGEGEKLPKATETGAYKKYSPIGETYIYGKSA